MRTSRKLALSLALGATAAVSALAPAVASADTYAPQPNAQTFATSVGGWTNATNPDGLCIPAVNCPLITNSYQSSGGVGGGSDGFIRSSVIALLGAGAINTGVWTSPPFSYTGNGGNVPTSVTFNLARRSNVGALISAPGNVATYQVDLINTGTNAAVQVLPSANLVDTLGWQSIPTIAVDPAQLTLGANYVIRIRSNFATVADVIPMGNADYDNVVLTTAGNASGGGGGGAGTGASGQSPYSSAAAVQACINNARKSVRKIKNKAKRKKKLKKKIANCRGTKVKKKKRKGRKRK